MRRLLSVLVILCLAVGMLCIPAVAVDKAYTLDASSGAVATTNGFVGTVTRNNDGTYTASYTSPDLKTNGHYVLLSVSVDGDDYTDYSISEGSIQYIDQIVSEADESNGQVVFKNFIPKSFGQNQVLLLGGKFNNNVDSPVSLGAILKQGVKVTGYVQGYNPKNPVEVEFYPQGTYDLCIGNGSTDSYANKVKTLDGRVVATGESATGTGYGVYGTSFVAEGIGSGDVYDVRIKKAGHTDYWIKGYAVGNEDCNMNTSASPYVMKCGDVNGDGQVNGGDVSVIIADNNFMAFTDQAENASADLNGDGQVNGDDINLAIIDEHYMAWHTLVTIK